MYYQINAHVVVLLWLLVNLLLPMFLPTLILYAYSLTTDGVGFWTIFMELLNRGMYVFSSFTLCFSLFEDYSIAKQVIKPYHYMMMAVLLIFIIFMFIASNPLAGKETLNRFKDISSSFIVVFILLVGLSSWLKYQIQINKCYK